MRQESANEGGQGKSTNKKHQMTKISKNHQHDLHSSGSGEAAFKCPSSNCVDFASALTSLRLDSHSLACRNRQNCMLADFAAKTRMIAKIAGEFESASGAGRKFRGNI
jgi:hypothetical protein